MNRRDLSLAINTLLWWLSQGYLLHVIDDCYTSLQVWLNCSVIVNFLVTEHLANFMVNEVQLYTDKST